MANVTTALLLGATYDGSVKHCVINYALVAAGVGLHTVPEASPVDQRGGWVPLAVVIAVLQVSLWLVMNAAGVSLVWSALYGHAFAGTGGRGRPLRLALLSAGALGLVYYAVTFPPVTTVAHLLAALMGAGWFCGWRSIEGRKLSA
ncbi:hypothetical protein [Novosphingobium sp. 9]|uniref:hypothetical protein n=1 Tax=Novosphingobium sp. 9 TaxID=2025349 RepID=UPI0021B4DF4C|nr:hypothetical protein [Novosphingobium sp. 9]